MRATLSRVTDCLSTFEETSSPSEYRATLVKYEEVMCSIKFVFAPTQLYTENGSVNSKRAHPRSPGICHLVGPGVGDFPENLFSGMGHLSILLKQVNVVPFSTSR